jgi:DNA-binding NarL/FixJ family response regulator
MESWQRVARSVSWKWRRHSLAEELEATAAFAAWQHRDDHPSLMVTAARSAMIDELRRCTGGRRTSARRRGHAATFPSDRNDFAASTDHEPFSPATLYGLRGRMAVIANALALGESKVEIARRLGVTPSRVSQLIHELREIVNQGEEP